MQSCAWMKGQYQQVGPPPQQQAGTADDSWRYRTANTGVRPPQSANFTYDNQAYSNRQCSNWPHSAVPHQAVSSQQPAGRNRYYPKLLTGLLLQSSTNTQSENPSLPVNVGFQQDVYQNSAQNSSTQSPPNTVNVNTTYAQQNMSAQWNQMARVHGQQSVRAQEGNVVSDLQHNGNLSRFFHNVNGKSTKSFSAYTTTAVSPPQQKVVYSSTLEPAAVRNRQTAINHYHKQNSTQHSFSSSFAPPDYSTAISQSVRNSSIPTNSSSGQTVHVSSTSQKAQQYLTHNDEREAKSSTDSNLCSRQYEISMIAKIVDDLHKSFPAASDGRSPVYKSSPYGGKQFGSKVRVMASNQNMQPMTSTTTQSYNSNASQSLSLNSGHVLSKTIHDVTSTQQRVVVPQQQNSVPDVFHVMPTCNGKGNGNGSKAANTFFVEKNIGSLSAASQLKQMSESISQRRNETQSSVAISRERLEILEMLSSVKTNDSPSHSSPGRTRAVAVVQPLSHESQSSQGTALDESLRNPEKFLISPKNISDSTTNQMSSNKSAGTSVSSSDSAGLRDLLQKRSCVDDTRSELANSMQVDQAVAPSAQQLVTSEAPVIQSGDKDNSEMPTDPKGFFELSSVPITPWTALKLTKLLQDSEKSQMEIKSFPKSEPLYTLLYMFWNGSTENLSSEIKAGWFKNLMADVQKFCHEHVTSESVILSQVKQRFGEQLKSFHVLKDNEVYSELPYKSSWLNANDQLDDIDKEFGFPWSLKHLPLMPESDSQRNQVQIDNGISTQISSEMSNKTELEPLELREEKQESTVGTTSTRTASPKGTESADSSDPYCNIEIQVLPPEEARAIFEQVQSQLSQTTDTDNQPERAMSNSVVDEPPKVMDATLSDTKLVDEPVCPIEEICCVRRYVELIWGPNAASSSKCQCKDEQSHEDITDKALDKKEMAVQKKDELCVISSAKGESQAKAGENVGRQVMTINWPELRNEQGHTLDFTEDTSKPHPYSDKEQKNVSQININSSQSSIILIDESEDDLSSSENEVPNKMQDSENEQAQVKLTKSHQSSGSDKKETKDFSRSDTDIQSDPRADCVRFQLKSTGSMQSCALNSSDQDTEDLSSSLSGVASQTSDLKENCGQAQLTSTNVAESSLETGGQTDMGATDTLHTTWSGKHETVERKRKRPSSHDNFFPIFKKSKKCKSLVDVDSQPVFEGASKCRKAFVDVVDGELSASNVKTAELVLFGSTQDKNVSTACRRSSCSSPVSESDAVPRPPKVITVNLSPLRRESAGEYSVKQQLYEKYRNFPLSKIRHTRSLKKQKCTFPSSSVGSLRKGETVCSVNTEELPLSYKMRKCLSLTRRRRFLSNKLKRREKAMKKYSVTLNQHADQERSKAEDGSHAVTPLQSNIVLKFTVLPNTFNFKDGSSGKEDISDPVPDKPDLVEEEDKSHNKAVTEARDKWLPNPEKKYSPLVKTFSIFNEYQKKFMERRRTSVD